MEARTRNIELKEALSLIFIEAKKFFEAATIKFIDDDERRHYYGLSIVIDDDEKGVEKITPFKYKMSRDTLAGLYTALVKNGGKNNIQKMITCLNKAIIDGYFRGGPSWAIETLKNNNREDVTVDTVIKMFCGIIADAIGTATARDNGGLYRLLGGEEECYLFFADVLEAVEDGIPELEDIFSVPKIHTLPKIPCYTCKYSEVENGVRRCTKYKHLVTPQKYAENPEKWIDGEFSNDCGGFVSAIIDERCSKCDTYECRIKQRTAR